MKNTAPRSFTFMELMIAMIVLAVLATLVLIPAFQGTMENAKRQTCQSQEKFLLTLLSIYAREHDNFPANFSVSQLVAVNSGSAHCPSMTSGGSSYGVNYRLPGNATSVYWGLPNATVVIADCDSAAFTVIGNLAFRHNKAPGGVANVITRNGNLSTVNASASLTF
jgi:type II secretory pathway pseudopilin PulG